MEKNKIVIIRSGPTSKDPWLTKILDGLYGSNYLITLLCWNREMNENNKHDYYERICLNLKAPLGIKILPFLIFWWLFVFFKLMITKCDLVHVINLDSVIPAIIACKLKRKPIIYEIYDVYVDLIPLPNIIRKFGLKLEKFCMKFSNAVIIANKAQRKELKGIPNEKVIEIYKTPPLCTFNNLNIHKNNVFTLFYAGVLVKTRPMNLDKMFSAIKNIEGIQLIIAGYGDMVKDIKREVLELGNKAKFVGELSYEKVLEQTMKSDLLFALYDSNIISVKHASCNKLFEAMMAKKPIIVSKDTAMADMVNEEKCGIIVDPNNVSEIKNAILNLMQNPDLCMELGHNGRKAYEQKYNKRIMDQRLLNLYQDILNS